ncbi:MAG TPA: aminotransferase class V-fold PLP-dependent enzyme [Ktedonosporobacter sp.]|nr:aminotransferase class V-fold PLP-dependent enzyme [Ktedonosporobacter sp.]
MDELLNEASVRAQRYLAGLDRRGVAPTPEALADLIKLDGPLPDEPTHPTLVLDQLDTFGSPATVATAGPRYFGFVTGGALPAALAANWLAGSWDQCGWMYVTSPVIATLEEITLRWLFDVLGLPATCGGAFVTGATMANFSALAAARHHLLQQVGWDVEADGLFGAPPVAVIVGEEAHPSVLKALGLLGFGRQRVIKVPVDEQGRMRAESLPVISGPTIVCLQAGNVNTGAFDPAYEIIPRAHDAGAWVHVDGAFGLWAAVSPAHAYLVRDYGEADSWVADAHKWLNVPYDSGLVFLRDPAALRAAMSTSAAYMPLEENRDPGQFTPEASRRGRSIEIWAALRSLGRSGLTNLIERTCRYAHYFAEGLQSAGYPILNDVVLNQVLVSFGDEAMTRRVVEAIQRDGTCWCGSTVWQGQTAMRISISSWATTEADIVQSLAAVLRIAREQRAAR